VEKPPYWFSSAAAKSAILSIAPMLPTFLSTPEAFAAFVSAWESGTLPKPEWTHAAHVAICACYTVRFKHSAFDQMKAGIVRHNEAVGTLNGPDSGYHETLTRFWTNIIAASTNPTHDPWQAACHAVAKFGEARTLHTRYYTFDVVHSPEARQTWVPPDQSPSR